MGVSYYHKTSAMYNKRQMDGSSVLYFILSSFNLSSLIDKMRGKVVRRSILLCLAQEKQTFPLNTPRYPKTNQTKRKTNRPMIALK